jgi:hypothetical protein
MQHIVFIGPGFTKIATRFYRYEIIFIYRKVGQDILTHGAASVGAG